MQLRLFFFLEVVKVLQNLRNLTLNFVQVSWYHLNVILSGLILLILNIY